MTLPLLETGLNIIFICRKYLGTIDIRNLSCYRASEADPGETRGIHPSAEQGKVVGSFVRGLTSLVQITIINELR